MSGRARGLGPGWQGFACLGALLCGASGCSLGPSASQKAEAGRIVHALDALRAAPNAQKLELFSALLEAPCETPELCALKELCTAGYGVHLRALGDVARAKARLAEPAGEIEAGTLLASARRDLDQAAAELARCTDAEGAAQRKYKP